MVICGKNEIPASLGWAEIDLSALTHNVRVIRQYLQPYTQLAAVVKKNAYGHGLLPVARTMVSAGVNYLGVYSLEEGLELRQANITIPILVFGFISPDAAKIVIRAHITPTVMEPKLAVSLNDAAVELDTIVKVHLKVDSGLNRSGLTLEETHNLFTLLLSLDRLKVEGLYTHFSSADEIDNTPTQTQLKRFLNLARNHPLVELLHTANSAATLRYPNTHLDLVRVGIALYGLYPSSSMKRSIPLRPVLSLKVRITRIHRLKAGDSVGYGLTWTSANDALVALVPLGYGDGLPRLLSNRGEALVRGCRVPIRGVISMDQCVVEVTGVPEARVGDEVTFIGSQPPEQISADEVARWANTINYEIVTALPPRLPRVYLPSA